MRWRRATCGGATRRATGDEERRQQPRLACQVLAGQHRPAGVRPNGGLPLPRCRPSYPRPPPRRRPSYPRPPPRRRPCYPRPPPHRRLPTSPATMPMPPTALTMPAIWYISYAATAARNRAAGPMRVVGPGLREAGPPAEVAAPKAGRDAAAAAPRIDAGEPANDRPGFGRLAV